MVSQLHLRVELESVLPGGLGRTRAVIFHVPPKNTRTRKLNVREVHSKINQSQLAPTGCLRLNIIEPWCTVIASGIPPLPPSTATCVSTTCLRLPHVRRYVCRSAFLAANLDVHPWLPGDDRVAVHFYLAQRVEGSGGL